MAKSVDVVVIGSGQAGLSIGYYLKKSDLSFILLDSSNKIGDVWRNRYDSLVLFSPRNYSSLVGLDIPGDPKGFCTKDEIADYLEIYAETFSIPVSLDTEVLSLEKEQDHFIITTSRGKWVARNVIVATGPFQKPFIPSMQEKLSKDIFQLHSSQYKNPTQLTEGDVLVIGGGNSGSQIATELSKSHDVYISTGHPMRFVPKYFMNKSIFWWFDLSQLTKVSIDSKLAKYLRKNEPVIGTELKHLIDEGKVKAMTRTSDFDDREIIFKDGSKLEVDNIIWCTGYRPDYKWINIKGATNKLTGPIHKKGISPVDGLYFLGLPWLSRLGSSLLTGVDYDAKRIYKYIIDKNKNN